jgi:glutamyl-tRNA synthetase
MTDSLKQERVRFAPSPTGYLHVGGARTALFNWLFARHHNGKFLLRIEDTDTERSDDKMVNAIFDGLKWLKLNWDEQPVLQSQRVDYHRAVVQKLIEAQKAYYCYCSPERLTKLREQAQQEQKPIQYDQHCRDLSAAEIAQYELQGCPKVVRFKMATGATSFQDVVHGSLTVNHQEIDDFIILRSDGMPTYNLAVVADDHDMGITTVIRGDDHLSNTPKQILLYQALSWDVPRFGHVPLILGTDKKRLSKRHGATSIAEFRDKGYLADAFRNYLALLGWSPGNDREIMPQTELIDAFDLPGI